MSSESNSTLFLLNTVFTLSKLRVNYGCKARNGLEGGLLTIESPVGTRQMDGMNRIYMLLVEFEVLCDYFNVRSISEESTEVSSLNIQWMPANEIE